MRSSRSAALRFFVLGRELNRRCSVAVDRRVATNAMGGALRLVMVRVRTLSLIFAHGSHGRVVASKMLDRSSAPKDSSKRSRPSLTLAYPEGRDCGKRYWHSVSRHRAVPLGEGTLAVLSQYSRSTLAVLSHATVPRCASARRTGTLFVERKFIHSAGLAGHIEDVRLPTAPLSVHRTPEYSRQSQVPTAPLSTHSSPECPTHPRVLTAPPSTRRRPKHAPHPRVPRAKAGLPTLPQPGSRPTPHY